MKNHQDVAVSVLKKKLLACDEFMSATCSLKKALEDGEESAVLQLIRQRDNLIKVIDKLDQCLHSSLKAGLREESFDDIKHTEKISEILIEKLNQIASVNQECEDIASVGCEVMRIDLTELHRREEGLQGYARPATLIPKFLNVHS